MARVARATPSRRRMRSLLAAFRCGRGAASPSGCLPARSPSSRWTSRAEPRASPPSPRPTHMLSHAFYNVVHIVGIILLVSALAGAALRATSVAAGEDRAMRRLLAILHGSGAFLVLLGGFG